MKGDFNMQRSGAVLSILCAVAVLALILSGPCDLANMAAIAASYNPWTTVNLSAGDVVVYDSGTNNAVKTTTTQGDPTVAGVAYASASAYQQVMVRSDGDLVVTNVTTATAGQWLITSTTAGKAVGVDTWQKGVFGYARTSAGTPAANQVYASISIGWQHDALTSAMISDLLHNAWMIADQYVQSATYPSDDQFLRYDLATKAWKMETVSLGATDHGELTGLADDDHTQYGALAQDETITGNWVNTANPWADNEVADTLTIGASSTVADGALSAQVAHLNVAETITENWVNTANPWA